MEVVFVWLGLFVGTAMTDWLSARWVDSQSALRRANISAIHEAVGFASGFAIYTWTKDVWMIIPCVVGAWVGSWIAGKQHDLDPELIEAITDAVALALDRNERANVRM